MQPISSLWNISFKLETWLIYDRLCNSLEKNDIILLKLGYQQKKLTNDALTVFGMGVFVISAKVGF